MAYAVRRNGLPSSFGLRQPEVTMMSPKKLIASVLKRLARPLVAEEAILEVTTRSRRS